MTHPENKYRLGPGGGPRRYEVYTNVLKMNNEVFDWLWKDLRSGLILSAGEVLDSMATPDIAKNLVAVIERFREHSPGRDKQLLLLTKSTNIPDCEPCENVILSWSINAPTTAKIFEHGAPSVMHRLEAAQRAVYLGWRVRLRLDPIKSMDWDMGHDKDIVSLIHPLGPERITLGTIRKNGRPTMYPRGVGGLHGRIDIYRKLIGPLSEFTEVGLCKETPEVYKALGMSQKDIKCNCTA